MHTTEVTLTTSTGILHAAFDTPDVDPPWTYLLLLAGSGPTDRDGNTPLVPEPIDNLRQIGRALARHGIAVVRPDKRGVGGSASAAPAEHEMTIDVLAADAAAWLDLISTGSEHRAVVIAGHSEGALIATIAAQQHRCDGVITLAAPGRPAGEVLREQLRRLLPGEQYETADAILRSLEHGTHVHDTPPELDALFRPTVQPYLISWLTIDPLDELANAGLPALILHGTDDAQVPAADAHRLASYPRAELVELPGVDHLLRPPHSTTIDPRVCDAITNFIQHLEPTL